MNPQGSKENDKNKKTGLPDVVLLFGGSGTGSFAA